MNKTILSLLVAGAVALSGCSVLQSQVNHAVDQALALALPDLDAAHTTAVAMKDPNPAHDMCWVGLADAIRAQQAADAAAGTPALPAAPVGLASAAEDLLLSNVTPVVVVLPPLPPGVKSACYATIGELQVKANVDAIKMSASITATLRKLKLG